jgi:hypothetical protein
VSIGDIFTALSLNFLIGLLVVLAIDDKHHTLMRWLFRAPTFWLFALALELWPVILVLEALAILRRR